MNERIKQLAEQSGTDISGKWMSVNHLDRFVHLIVRELQLNGYDDAARCLVEELITTKD